MQTNAVEVASSEAFTDMTFQVEVFWFHPEDGGSMDLRNVGIPPQHYTASQPRRPPLEAVDVVISFRH
jgi:hypothetical protein